MDFFVSRQVGGHADREDKSVTSTNRIESGYEKVIEGELIK